MDTKLEQIRPKKTMAILVVKHTYHLETQELILLQEKEGTYSWWLDLTQGLDNQYVVL